MALDTANKRLSAINLGLPFRGILPLPDGSQSAQDRFELLYLYALEQPTQGLISFTEFEVPTVGVDPTKGRVSVLSFEVPNLPAKGRISFAEFEVPNLITKGRISFLEFEVPLVATKGRISQAYFEAPNLITKGRLSFVEFEVPVVGFIEPNNNALTGLSGMSSGGEIEDWP